MYVCMYSMGKEPTVHVWSTDIVDCSEPLLSLGKGFFYRGVCALEFSTDSQCMYLYLYFSVEAVPNVCVCMYEDAI